MTGNSSAPPPPVDEAVMQLLSHREAFLRFLSSRVSDSAIAEIACKRVYIKAVEKSGQPRQAESVVAWFYAFCRMR